MRYYKQMAISNEKIEIFIKEYLETDNATNAYRLTYPSKAKRWKSATLTNAAYKLLNNKKVKDRLAEVRKELEDQLYFGVRAAYEKYEKIYLMGLNKESPNLAAAKGAVDSQARLFGLLVDKTIVRVDVRDDFEDKLKKEMNNEEK